MREKEKFIPNKLNQKEIKEIGQQFAAYGLDYTSDQEHFIVKDGNRDIYIPKRKIFPDPDPENGESNNIEIKDYLEKLLKKENIN